MIFRKNNDIDDDYKERKYTKNKKIDLSNYKLPIIILVGAIFLIIIIFIVAKLFNSNKISYQDKLYYISLLGESDITLYLGENYNEPGYTGTDDSGNDLTQEVAVINNIDNNKIGNYKITYTLGNITKERNVKIIEKPVGATYIHLFGDINVFLYIGEKYIEKGYDVIDSVDGAKLKDKVTVTNNVDTSKEGIYKVIYSVKNSSGITTSKERTVVVMDRSISLLAVDTDITNKNVKINIYIKDELFDYLLLPNNVKTSEKVTTYEVSSNGTYKFVMYNTKGESIEKSITIDNIDRELPDGSCSGSYQNGVSQINISAKDNIGISRYDINGASYTANNIKLNGEFASVNVTIYDKAGNNKTISCKLENKNAPKPSIPSPTVPSPSYPSLNIASSFKDYNANGYSLYIPENATTNMPLLVMVSPAPNGHYEQKKIFTKNWHREKVPAFIMIAHNMKNYNEIRNNIDLIVDKYSIDKSRISAYGVSSSGTYVYYLLAKNKDIFSALIVVSSGITSDYSIIQDNLDYFKTLPTKGYGETGGQYDGNGKRCSGWTNWSPSGHMRPLFNYLGRPNDFVDVGKMCHSEVSTYIFNLDANNDNKSDIIEWAISQTKK